jgi:hypothetical protein
VQTPSDLLLELPAFQYGPQTLDETTDPWTISDNLLFPIIPFFYGPYWPRIEVFPRLAVSVANGGVGTGLLARQQIEDSVRVPSRSFLVGFSAVSPQAAGFVFTLFDVGRNDWCFTQKWQNNRCSAEDDTDSDRSIPAYLIRPYPVVDAGGGWGKINLRMTNSATVSNDCALALYFCVPAGKVRTIGDPGNSRTGRTGRGNW